MSLPKITFIQNGHFANMDDVFIDEKKKVNQVPGWLFKLLPAGKQEIAYNALEDMFIAGYIEGQDQLSKELQTLLIKLRAL